MLRSKQLLSHDPVGPFDPVHPRRAARWAATGDARRPRHAQCSQAPPGPGTQLPGRSRLNAAEARKVLQLAENDRLHTLYVLALYLGMRRAELLGLPWDAVDLEQGVLEVRQSLQRVRGELPMIKQ